jgi:succinoglycan biosynthesis protein ExoM
LRAEPGPFDPVFGLSTGEDGDLLLRLVAKGAKLVWCDEAIVWEPVENKRLSLRWLLLRALSGGQHFARLRGAGRYGTVAPAARTMLAVQWFAQLLVALILAILCAPLGKHRTAAWLIKAAANFGKLTAILGWRYAEYA